MASPAPPTAYHLVHAGFRRRETVRGDRDYCYYLALLAKYARRRVSLLAFCLMRNHVHIVAAPADVIVLETVIRTIHGSYAALLGLSADGQGRIWQRTWRQRQLDFAAAWNVVRYVEMNPVQAALVPAAHLYRWSSAQAHVTGSDPHGVLDMRRWRRLFGGCCWAAQLRSWLEEGPQLHRPPLTRWAGLRRRA